MMLLRTILFIYAGLSILGAVIISREAGTWNLLLAAYLLLNSLVIIGGLVFERKRYKPKGQSPIGWQPTGERFIDPTTHKLIEVQYNPKTGERNYREVESK
jgi:hypothetical protein